MVVDQNSIGDSGHLDGESSDQDVNATDGDTIQNNVVNPKLQPSPKSAQIGRSVYCRVYHRTIVN